MSEFQQDKISQYCTAFEKMMKYYLETKRLMPEVEAELSLMGGVGAALEKKSNKNIAIEAKKRFHKQVINNKN